MPDHRPNLPYDAYCRASWFQHEETIRLLMPAMDVAALRAVVIDLRTNMHGRWTHMPPGIDDRRRLLLHDVATAAAERAGEPWPWLDDLLPDGDRLAAQLLGDQADDDGDGDGDDAAGQAVGS
jgi:hypothetical protein